MLERYTSMKKKLISFGLVFSLLSFLYGCYSFKGIAIDPDINTYFVEQFVDNTGSGVPTVAIDFSEKLKDKVRNESRLVFKETDPDIAFSGSISRYDVQTSATAANNKFYIGVRVSLEKFKGEDVEDQDFNLSFFAEFSNEVNFSDVQAELEEQIIDQLVTDVFNKAFTNW